VLCRSLTGFTLFLGRDIGKRLEVRRKVDACLGKANYISRLEHAQARLTLSYNRRGDLAIHLVSPMGTRSTLLAARSVPGQWDGSWQRLPGCVTHTVSSLPRPHDYSADGFNDWAFMTTHSWDEDPSGEWLLEIENTSDANNYGRAAVTALMRQWEQCLRPAGTWCCSVTRLGRGQLLWLGGALRWPFPHNPVCACSWRCPRGPRAACGGVGAHPPCRRSTGALLVLTPCCSRHTDQVHAGAVRDGH